METHIYTAGSGVYSLEQPLKPAIVRRINRIVQLAKRRRDAYDAGDGGELLRIASEYAQMKYMQNTARQVMRDAEDIR